jgi:hypothetical protein
MASEWFYTRDGKTKIGPVSWVQLQELTKSGQLLPTDRVWKEGIAKWTSASEIKGLFSTPNSSQPPPLPAALPWSAPPVVPMEAVPADGQPDMSEAVPAGPALPPGLVRVLYLIGLTLAAGLIMGIVTRTVPAWLGFSALAAVILVTYRYLSQRTTDATARPSLSSTVGHDIWFIAVSAAAGLTMGIVTQTVPPWLGLTALYVLVCVFIRHIKGQGRKSPGSSRARDTDLVQDEQRDAQGAPLDNDEGLLHQPQAQGSAAPPKSYGALGWFFGVPPTAKCPKCRRTVFWSPCPDCNGTRWVRASSPFNGNIVGMRCANCDSLYCTCTCECGCEVKACWF